MALLVNKIKDELYRLRSLLYHNVISNLFKRLLIRFYVQQKNFHPDKNIIICSEARGGSTWLMEVLSSIPKTTIYWEPLHRKRGVAPKNLNFGEHVFVSENDTKPEFFSFFRKMLAAKYINEWVMLRSTTQKYREADKLIIKFVRANLILPWLTRNFEFKHLPILLLRHPIPTCMSQIRAFENDTPFKSFEIPQGLYDISNYKTHETFLKSMNTKLELSVALWCVHNLYTLNHPNTNKKWLLVFYENLLLQPELEFTRISEALQIQIPKVDTKLKKASSTDFKGDFKQDPQKQLSKWQSKLSKEETNRMQYIFDYFDLKIYRADSPFVHT